jgi:hypothetical protein
MAKRRQTFERKARKMKAARKARAMAREQTANRGPDRAATGRAKSVQTAQGGGTA